MKKEKVFRKITIGLLSLFVMSLFTLATSCSDDDEAVKEEKTIKWYYKVEASAGSTITNIVHDINPNLLNHADVSITEINGTTWTSSEVGQTSLVVPGNSNNGVINMYIKAKATGKDVSSTLKVQIYVDGVLWKEIKDYGQNLTAEARYVYNY